MNKKNPAEHLADVFTRQGLAHALRHIKDRNLLSEEFLGDPDGATGPDQFKLNAEATFSIAATLSDMLHTMTVIREEDVSSSSSSSQMKNKKQQAACAPDLPDFLLAARDAVTRLSFIYRMFRKHGSAVVSERLAEGCAAKATNLDSEADQLCEYMDNHGIHVPPMLKHSTLAISVRAASRGGTAAAAAAAGGENERDGWDSVRKKTPAEIGRDVFFGRQQQQRAAASSSASKPLQARTTNTTTTAHDARDEEEDAASPCSEIWGDASPSRLEQQYLGSPNDEDEGLFSSPITRGGNVGAKKNMMSMSMASVSTAGQDTLGQSRHRPSLSTSTTPVTMMMEENVARGKAAGQQQQQAHRRLDLSESAEMPTVSPFKGKRSARDVLEQARDTRPQYHAPEQEKEDVPVGSNEEVATKTQRKKEGKEDEGENGGDKQTGQENAIADPKGVVFSPPNMRQRVIDLHEKARIEAEVKRRRTPAVGQARVNDIFYRTHRDSVIDTIKARVVVRSPLMIFLTLVAIFCVMWFRPEEGYSTKATALIIFAALVQLALWFLVGDPIFINPNKKVASFDREWVDPVEEELAWRTRFMRKRQTQLEAEDRLRREEAERIYLQRHNPLAPAYNNNNSLYNNNQQSSSIPSFFNQQQVQQQQRWSATYNNSNFYHHQPPQYPEGPNRSYDPWAHAGAHDPRARPPPPPAASSNVNNNNYNNRPGNSPAPTAPAAASSGQKTFLRRGQGTAGGMAAAGRPPPAPQNRQPANQPGGVMDFGHF